MGVLLLAAALAAATLVGFLYLALAELPESSPSQAAASFRHGTGGPAPYGPLSPLSRLGRTRAERARNLIRALGDRVGGRDGEALAELRRDSRRREERLRREERDMTAIEEDERQREEERRRGREEGEGGGGTPAGGWGRARPLAPRRRSVLHIACTIYYITILMSFVGRAGAI